MNENQTTNNKNIFSYIAFCCFVAFICLIAGAVIGSIITGKPNSAANPRSPQPVESQAATRSPAPTTINALIEINSADKERIRALETLLEIERKGRADETATRQRIESQLKNAHNIIREITAGNSGGQDFYTRLGKILDEIEKQFNSR